MGKNNGNLNPDGSINYNGNSSTLATSQNAKAALTLKGTKEVKGDNADREMKQFEQCKYKRESCKYIDLYGNCMAENCLFDQEECPPLTKKYFTECIICKEKFCVDPRDMRAYICQSCLDRIHRVEVLPFECVHCGKLQHHPAIIPFSGICDECFHNELFNDQYTVDPEDPHIHNYHRKNGDYSAS
jgi:hypothetical protein